jgi:glycosyltransferase involved in cell wall biosynthesis
MVFILNKRARIARNVPAARSSQNRQQLLSAADQARDERRWQEAAEFYKQYLMVRPADAPIWVQFGHALKESGNLAEAESAYKKSLALAPDVGDTQLQLGHLYKKMRNFSNAIAAYCEAFRIDNTLFDARRELANLGISASEVFSTEALRKPTMLIDLSDVFFYLHHHQTVSGIQRVQLGIANAIIAMTSEERSATLFLSQSGDGRDYVIIDDVFVTELSRELARNEVDHARLIDVMRPATSLGRPYEPVAGDSLLLLGAFWVLPNIVERIILLKRKGVHVGTLIHDLIPITHPEFCEKSLTEAFKAYVFRVLSLVDFITAQSEYSERCVKDFMTKNHISGVPIRTIKSAHKTWNAPIRPTALSPGIARIIKEEFVLYVSTIEIRKNHVYLFRIWKRLIEKLGKKTPRLVFVGRCGWRIADLMNQLESTSNLNGHICIFYNLSDAELAALYQSALFTVFPSFEEGWGLPVGESLIFGRPCIASNCSSVPEVGGSFADYIDPFNDNDGYEKILRFIQDRKFLEERARNIKENFKAREWSDVAKDLIKLVPSLVAGSATRNKTIEMPRAVPGHIYRLGHRDDASRFVESGDSEFAHFACDIGWDRVEEFGRWMRDRNARVEFVTEQGANGAVAILILVETFTVNWLSSMRLQITINGADYPIIKLKPGVRSCLLLHFTPDRGRVALEFSGIGDIVAGDDPRKFLWLGLGSLGYAPATDALARVMLLEELLTSVTEIVTLRPTPTP